MVQYFSIANPLLMGQGAAALAGEKAKELGITKIILVYDEGLKATGLGAKVEKYFLDAGINVVTFNGVTPDPTDISIMEGMNLAKKAGGVNGVVGLGGGSCLDTAKGINVLLSNEPPLVDYSVFGSGKKPQKSFPLILIPTTAGTGSECTFTSVVTFPELGLKGGVRSTECCLADLAIIDPYMSAGMPPKLTAGTGIDAFTHAAEAMTVKREAQNPVSEALAKEAIVRLMKWLPIAVEDGTNMEARENVAISASLAGIAFTNTLVHLGHAFGHSIGAECHIPHGMAVGAAIPQAIHYMADVLPDKVQLLGECMGIIFTGEESPKEIGTIVAEAILQFRRDIKLPTLEELGLSKENVIAAWPKVKKDGCYPFTAKEIDDDETIKEILAKIYDNVL